MRIQIDDVVARKAARSISKRSGQIGELTLSCGRMKGVDKECACAGIDLGDQPEHASAVIDALGVALLNRGCLVEGAKLIEQALRIRRKVFGDDHPTTALSFNSLARVLRERGELSAAEQTAQAALRINRRTARDQPALPVAISLYELGGVNLSQGRFADAERAAIEGLQILQTLGIDDTDPHTSRLLDIRGRAEAARNDFDAAKATFEALVKLDRNQVGADHPKFATHLSNFASVKESLGLFKQAETDYLRAIFVYANRLKRRCHPNLIDMYANLGSLYLHRNNKPTDLRNAARYLKEALRLNLKVRGPMHLLTANDFANLGRLHYTIKDRRGALKHFLTALNIYAKNLKRGTIPESYPFIAEVLTWIGRLLCEGGGHKDAAKAEPLLERAIANWSAGGASGAIGKLAAEAAVGRSLHLQGKTPERVRQLLTDAHGALSKELGADYAYVKIVRRWLDELDLLRAA